MKYSNEFLVGITAHELFRNIAIKRGWEAKNATKKQDIVDHIDIILTKHDLVCSFDVKAKKKISRSDAESQDEWVFVEFKNVRGNDGWLKGKADFIAFETNNSFVIVKRKKLLEYCNDVVTMERVRDPYECHYKRYTRSGRKDEISLIKLEEIPKDYKISWDK